MKAENKLKKVLEDLMWYSQDDCKVVNDETKAICKQLAQTLNEFYLANNLKKVSTKLNIYDCVSKDSLQPALCYVWHNHDEKVAVASNCMIIVESKLDYDPTLEPNEKCLGWNGSAVNKKGEKLQNSSRFPKYKDVFPRKEALCEIPDLITREQLSEALSLAQAAKKEPGVGRVIVRVGENYWFDHVELKRFAGVPDWTLVRGTKGNDDNFDPRRIMCYFDENYAVGMMPSTKPRDEDERYQGNDRVFAYRGR